MSLKIDGDHIYLTRGDSAHLTIEPVVKDISGQTTEYVAQEGDVCRFALKKNMSNPNEETILTIDIPVDTWILDIEPEDTKDLKFTTYNYDVQITHENGDVSTIIPETPTDKPCFTVCAEVD